MSWRMEIVLFFVLFGLTFGIVLPRICRHWRYSYYYQASEAQLGEQSLGDTWAASDEHSANTYKTTSVTEYRFSLLVTIVTVGRPGRYLSRVVRKLHQMIGRSPFQVMICNVDSGVHNEALSLSRTYRHFHRVDRYPHHPNPRQHGDTGQQNVFEKEKDDYVFCLNASRIMFQSDYILMLEDDALPTDDLLPVTSHLLQNRLRKHPDFYYIKLYHPERLQGFLQPEPWRIAEWLALSVSLGSILALPCSAFLGRRSQRYQRHTKCATLMRWRYFLCWTLYFMCLTETIGRAHLLELRRLSPHLYNVLAATECCTPAMLFSSASSVSISEFLSSIQCKPGYAKDTALYDHIRRNRIKSFVVEPNLVRHIGDRSSVRN